MFVDRLTKVGRTKMCHLLIREENIRTGWRRKPFIDRVWHHLLTGQWPVENPVITLVAHRQSQNGVDFNYKKPFRYTSPFLSPSSTHSITTHSIYLYPNQTLLQQPNHTHPSQCLALLLLLFTSPSKFPLALIPSGSTMVDGLCPFLKRVRRWIHGLRWRCCRRESRFFSTLSLWMTLHPLMFSCWRPCRSTSDGRMVPRTSLFPDLLVNSRLWVSFLILLLHRSHDLMRLLRSF